MSREDLIQNLLDAGCGGETAAQFLGCLDKGDLQKAMKLLERQRSALLESVHEGQRKIDCLDYLVYQMNRQTS